MKKVFAIFVAAFIGGSVFAAGTISTLGGVRQPSKNSMARISIGSYIKKQVVKSPNGSGGTGTGSTTTPISSTTPDGSSAYADAEDIAEVQSNVNAVSGQVTSLQQMLNNDFYNKTATDDLLETKADTADVYNKQQVDAMALTKQNVLPSGYEGQILTLTTSGPMWQTITTDVGSGLPPATGGTGLYLINIGVGGVASMQKVTLTGNYGS